MNERAEQEETPKSVYLYVKGNPDWISEKKYKYGYTENPVNRLHDSSEEHSEKSQYVALFEFKETNEYQEFGFPERPDEIISTFSSQDFIEISENDFGKLSYLQKLVPFLVHSKTKETNEFIYSDGLETLKNVFKYDFPKLGLLLEKEFDPEEIAKINASNPSRSKQNPNKKELRKKLLSKLREMKMKKEKAHEQLKKLQNKQYINRDKEPLHYHVPMLEKMINHFENNENGHMIEPCGSGKSFLSIYYTKTVGYKTIVIGTPSVYLQTQMRDEILEVIPDATIRFAGGDSDTPVETIKQELHNSRENPLFVITTYASCSKLVGLHFDIKIGDECHHLVGIGRENDGYLRFHDIHSNKSLFMTATNKIVDTTNYNTVFSMDDEEIFGKCIDEKSVKWAIDNEVITDYKVVVLKATGNNLDDIIGDLDIQLNDKTIEIFVSAYMTLKSIASYNDLSHILCYTNTTTHAELMHTFIDILLDKGIFPSLDKEEFYNKALHSGSKCVLTDEVDIMKNKNHGIISCVYIFGEGFNLPKLNGVCFVENMVSNIRIIQCALRSARIERGNPNKISYLLVPFIDHDDFNEENTSHKKIRTIISNLGNVDENIDERLFVNTLTRRETPTEQDIDKQAVGGNVVNEAYDFRNDDLELRRLRLRLRNSKDLKSKLSMEEEEYIFHKALMKEHNLKSKR